MIDSALGKLLAEARAQACVLHKEMASLSGLSSRTIVALENEGNYTQKTFKAYVNAFSILRKRTGGQGVRVVQVGGNWEIQPEPPSWLDYPEREWKPKLHGPGALLAADYTIVPFHGQHSLRARQELLDWCNRDEPHAVRVYKGEAGVGKTRLAIELCRSLANRGRETWTTGFARQEHFPALTSPYEALPYLGRPLLVVVDYAGERENMRLVQQLLLHLEKCTASKVRLIFLERNEVWLDHLHGSSALRDILHGPLFFREGRREVHLVPSAGNSLKDRSSSFRTARDHFSRRLKTPAHAEPPKEIGASLYERVLFIHSRALLDVLGSQVHGRARILLHLLARERDYWRKCLDARGFAPSLFSAVEHAVYQISREGGASDIAAGIAHLRKSRLLSGLSELVLHDVCLLLRECYPQGAQGIGPLQPDELKDSFLRDFHKRYDE